jgi:cbb3-type cytochrome oxidase subunit 3
MKKTILLAALIVCFIALSAYQYSAHALDQPSDLKIPDEKSNAKVKEYYKQGDSLLQSKTTRPLQGWGMDLHRKSCRKWE